MERIGETMFLTLTNSSEEKIRIQKKYILFYKNYNYSKDTVITILDSGDIVVKESPEEIDEMMRPILFLPSLDINDIIL